MVGNFKWKGPTSPYSPGGFQFSATNRYHGNNLCSRQKFIDAEPRRAIGNTTAPDVSCTGLTPSQVPRRVETGGGIIGSYKPASTCSAFLESPPLKGLRACSRMDPSKSFFHWQCESHPGVTDLPHSVAIISGFFSSTSSNRCPAWVGSRSPCSQLCTVFVDTFSTWAKTP